MVLERKDIPPQIREQAEKNLEFTRNKLGRSKDGKRDFIIASMFTTGTQYEIEVQKLKQGLDKFKVKYEIMGIKTQGSWEKNTQMKPQVIKTVMEKYKLPVVWMDADAELLKYPEFFHTITGDVSYHKIKEWNEMLTGTLYFADVPECMEFLDKWITLNNENFLPDAKNFQTIMEKDTKLKYVPLPADYIKIFDNPLIESKDPVIVHNQASRRLKNNVSIEKKDIIKTILVGLKNGQDTCSVIGNGPYESDLSKTIDNSFVMRCNNFKTGEQYKGIGTRIDMNISSLFYEIVPEEKVSYPIFGVLPISNTLYQQYTSAKMMHSYWQENALKLASMGNMVITYDDEDLFSDVFTDVARQINAFPTVGILAIAAARWIGYKKILISGFTFFETPKSHYFKDEIVKPSMHHNVKAEKMLLRNWIDQKNGIEYILDELTKKTLYDVTT
jgi:hypothetical protein